MTKLIVASCNFVNEPTSRVESCVSPHVFSPVKLLSEFKLLFVFAVYNNAVRIIHFFVSVQYNPNLLRYSRRILVPFPKK